MGKNNESKKIDADGEETINSKDFIKTVGTLLELLGRDMCSTNPSRDSDMLVALRDGLFRTEVAGQLFDHVKTFRALLEKHFPEIADVKLDRGRHISIAKACAKLSVQSFSGKSQIVDFMREFGVNMFDTQMAIFAITQFIEMLRRFPLKFFLDPDIRLRIVTSMQRELDELIVKEETEQTDGEGEAEEDCD
jgi:hypothetical protein